jgi:hypothetical protein
LIKLQKITELLELAIYSGHIKDEQPVSALITAPPEAGKTELVMKLAQNDGVIALTDCTAFGIMRDYGKAIRERKIRHLIIPDLVRPMSRGKETVHSLIAFLNALVEEGVMRISTYAEQVGAPILTTDLEEKIVPVKCGLIATIAKDILLDGRHHWARMGFMSRMLPISYEYGVPTKLEIHKSIAKKEYLAETPLKLALPNDDFKIQLIAPEADELMILSTTLASLTDRHNPERTYGFRLQKHLQRLAMASALKDGREQVQKGDVELIQELSSCINLDYYPL